MYACIPIFIGGTLFAHWSDCVDRNGKVFTLLGSYIDNRHA